MIVKEKKNSATVEKIVKLEDIVKNVTFIKFNIMLIIEKKFLI